ncbi:MAG TPA: 2-oxo-4-hydroxy-4-carboxy-5-ureidoimidazoline decarboxylase [Pyrinomonadaceae bacterium]|nr:2-oxo-4-hydroxy-4-carboxy-5-ureidoimidazoline decarboxylase [Pyrinomonadaceae bacterium]
MTEALKRLNALSPDEAQAELLKCCGSTNWARRMALRRPFQEMREVAEAADRIWRALEEKDWLEAFSHHPKIGEKKAAVAQTSASQRWSEEEQSGTRAASTEVLAELAEANRAYEERFGYIFIVCATGKSSEEMLALLKERLGNDPQTELRVAAEEQRRIMQLRLKKLLQG